MDCLVCAQFPSGFESRYGNPGYCTYPIPKCHADTLKMEVDRLVQYPGFPYRDSFPDGTRAQARWLVHECH